MRQGDPFSARLFRRGLACKLGLEGIVSKQRNSPSSSERSQHWIKSWTSRSGESNDTHEQFLIHDSQSAAGYCCDWESRKLGLAGLL